jgi:hypothetical protein
MIFVHLRKAAANSGKAFTSPVTVFAAPEHTRHNTKQRTAMNGVYLDYMMQRTGDVALRFHFSSINLKQIQHDNNLLLHLRQHNLLQLHNLLRLRNKVEEAEVVAAEVVVSVAADLGKVEEAEEVIVQW